MNKQLMLSLVVLTVFFQIKSYAQANLTLSSYKGQSQIMASQSITLLPGFEVKAGNELRIYIASNCVPLVSQPSNQNYSLINVIQTEGVKKEADLIGKGVCEIHQTVQYFDGLGRPIQTVQTMASPNLKDVVLPIEYDNCDRQARQYLSYVSNNGNGSFNADALSPNAGVKQFYKQAAPGIASTSYPYSESVFDNSPLSRALQNGAPGEAWQPFDANIANSGHTIKIEYGSNGTGEVKSWTINENGASSQFYAGGGVFTAVYIDAGMLYKTTIWDENENQTIEYKNKKGQIILKQVKYGSKSLATYYLYDDLGNLRYVLPPNIPESTISFTESDIIFKELIYAYHYDSRQRVVERKIPAKGWEYTVYNKLNQVVLTQDANQRNKTNDEWLFTKYDSFGRVVMTGLYKDGENITDLSNNSQRIALQSIVDAQNVSYESRLGIDYTNNSFPSDYIQTYTVNYYDNYIFNGNPYGLPGTGQSLMTSGLLTGSKVKVLDGSETYLWTVYYYDEKNRNIQTKSQNYAGGEDIISTTYNFPGQIITASREHTAYGKPRLTIATRYEYDHMGRKLNTFEKIGANTEVLLASYSYNELGQLIKKQLHSEDNGSSYLQAVDYGYNIRGWLKSSSAPKFSLNLKYEDASIGYKQYNGNVGEMFYSGERAVSKSFQYTYDKINRLTGSLSNGGLDEVLNYDVVGNIQTLERSGSTIIYNYQKNGVIGNQLQRTLGAVGATYDYDVNGNLIYNSKKNISLQYNHLNLINQVSGSQNIVYTYDAVGNKLRRTESDKKSDYINGICYEENGTLAFIQTEQGRAIPNGNSFIYEYNLKDHLGNIRVSFDKDPVSKTARVIQEDEYYAFGLRKGLFNNTNKYLYNGKELQESLNEYDYGARFYDPVIARWNILDKLADVMPSHSGYSFSLANPANFVDPDGNIPKYFQNQLNRAYDRMAIEMMAENGYPGLLQWQQYRIQMENQMWHEWYQGIKPLIAQDKANYANPLGLVGTIITTGLSYTPVIGNVMAATRNLQNGNTKAAALNFMLAGVEVGAIAGAGYKTAVVSKAPISTSLGGATYETVSGAPVSTIEHGVTKIEGKVIGLGLDTDLSYHRGTGAITYKNAGWQQAGLTKVDWGRAISDNYYFMESFKEAAKNAGTINFNVSNFDPMYSMQGITNFEFNHIINNSSLLQKTNFIQNGNNVFWNGNTFVK